MAKKSAKRDKDTRKKKKVDYTAPGYFADHIEEFYSPEAYKSLVERAKRVDAFLERIGATYGED